MLTMLTRLRRTRVSDFYDVVQRAAFASQSTMREMKVFNRATKLTQRNRAASQPDYQDYEFIRDHFAEQLVDRLLDIKKEFPVAVDVGCGAGHILKQLCNVGKVGKLIQLDSSSAMLRHGLRYKEQAAAKGIESEVLLANEEKLPFEENSVDLFLSSMSMHWLNDLPGLFAQINRCLKPEGVFLATILGGETLNELSSSFAMAELERKGGVSPHTSPLAQVSDVGSLLTDAGFKLVTVDTDIVHVNFRDALHAMETLQCMGDSNAAEGRMMGCGSETLLAAAAAYEHAFGFPAPDPIKDGEKETVVPCTFQAINMIGWKDSPALSKPLLRGSATKSLSQLSDMTSSSGAPKDGAVEEDTKREPGGLISRDRLPPGLR